MHTLVVYDVSEKKSKVCNFLRQYLVWVQNSVFEGDITESQISEIERGLESIIDKNKDSVIIYFLKFDDLLKKKIIGVKKNSDENII
ncbi:MAG: CRISPR-associated endonuclease Cas2 [Candidatus Aenigmarchaeota archaeon]|nr:CRISPR-associated endonuclease Cas2 [Candidatus Aenigmarchaeota archaeon]